MASSGRGEVATAAAIASWRMSANTVLMPSPTSAWAMARPMPLPAPVTRAASREGSNRGFNRFMIFELHSSHSGYLRYHDGQWFHVDYLKEPADAQKFMERC